MSKSRRSKSSRDSKQDKRLTKIEKKLRGIVELFVVEDLTNTPTMATTTVVTFLDVSKAKGFKQLVKSIRCTGFVKQAQGSTAQDDYRIDLVLDRHPEEDLLTPIEIYGSATPTMFAMIFEKGLKRFKILKSIRGIFNVSKGVGSHRVFDHTIKLNLMQECEQANSFSQANILKNALYWIAWTTATSNVPTVSFAWRAIVQATGG